MTRTGTRRAIITQRGGCVFELLARFNVPNQGYVNAQVLGPGEGVNVGQLTVVGVDGNAEVLAQAARLSGKAGNLWDLGFYSLAIARMLGKGLFTKLNVVGGIGRCMFSWEDTFPPAPNPVSPDYGVYLDNTNVYHCTDTPALTIIVGSYTVGTQYDYSMVIGGYDVNRTPWDNSQAAATYLYGAALFAKGGAQYPNWTLLWRWGQANTANLYPAAFLRQIGSIAEYDDFRVPVVDYSSVLQPTVKDTFTDANGTALAVHTSDIGGPITVQNGAYDIQANRANVTVSPAAPGAVFTIPGLADQFGRITVNTVVNGAGSFLYRYTDNNNFWYADVDDTANRFAIIERNGGVDNVRANAALAIAPATDYEITVTADGTAHQGFLDGGNRLSFVSAVGQNATLIGSRCRGVGTRLDNSHFQPRDGYVQLDQCP